MSTWSDVDVVPTLIRDNPRQTDNVPRFPISPH